MKKILKLLCLFAIGGMVYVAIEIMYRGNSHWSMFVVGGIAFLLVGGINEYIPWDMVLWEQAMWAMLQITIVEFLSGCVLNLAMELNVWDYSGVPLNILGQICVPFMAIWYLLSIVGILLDDYLRYWLFGEEKPHYRLK